MRLGSFIKNEEYGKNRQQLSGEIADVTSETRKRQANGLDTEDQQCREHNLREARGRIN
jgi:hypothetical protein